MQEILNKLCFVREVRTSGYQEMSSTLTKKFKSDVAVDPVISPVSCWSFLCITWLPHGLVHLLFIKLHYSLTI